MRNISRPSATHVFLARTLMNSLSQPYCDGLFVGTVAKLYQELLTAADDRLKELAGLKTGGMLVLMGSGMSYEQLRAETNELHDMRNSLVHEVYQRFGLDEFTHPANSVLHWMKAGATSKLFLENQDDMFKSSFQEALGQLEIVELSRKEFNERVAQAASEKKRLKSFDALASLLG